MKKVSLFAFIASSVAATWASAETASPVPCPPPCPKAFQGFHIGGNLGYDVGYGRQHFSSTEDGAAQITRNKLGLSGINGGIGTGYLHRFGGWGVGLVFDANWANTTGKVRRSISFTDAGGHPATIVHKARAKLQNSLQLYGKFGYVICEKVMPFFKLGWDNSRWKHSFTALNQEFRESTERDRVSKAKRLNALLWGLGVDFLATRHLAFGFEYTGTQAGRVTKHRTFDDGETGTARFKPQDNKFAMTVRLIYP